MVKISTFLKKWNNNGLTKEEYILIKKELYADSLKRAIFLLYLFSAMFTIYGLTSVEYFQKYDPSVSLWQNTLPRLCFNSIPFILLGFIIKKLKITDKSKLIFWMTSFSIIYFVAACINAWPIALNRHPEIIAYVNSPNIYIFTLVFIVIAPPIDIILTLVGILLLIFVLPFFFITYLSGDNILTKAVISDLSLSLISDIILASWISNVQAKNKYLEHEKQTMSNKYLGPFLTRAINKEVPMEDITKFGYIINIDMRGYTKMKEKYPENYKPFIKKYQNIVKTRVYEHFGYVHKSMGDGHTISFGVLDDQVDLSDVLGINEDEKIANINTNSQMLSNIIKCLQKIIDDSQQLMNVMQLDIKFRIRGGISVGNVEMSVCGNATHLEYDIVGDTVVMVARLESYCKYVVKNMTFDDHESIILITPNVTDFYNIIANDVVSVSCEKFFTKANPIRNYPEIPFVLPIVLSPKIHTFSSAVLTNSYGT